MRRIDGGILLPDEEGEMPWRCDCCVIPRIMQRALNGPDSRVVYCPSSRKGYAVKNGVLRPMPGFWTGEIAGQTRRIYGRRDEIKLVTAVA